MKQKMEKYVLFRNDFSNVIEDRIKKSQFCVSCLRFVNEGKEENCVISVAHSDKTLIYLRHYSKKPFNI